MKKYILVAISFFLTYSHLVRAEENVGVLHLPPLHLLMPPTWKFNGSSQPIEGHGPDGEKMLVTIMHLRPGSNITAKVSAADFAKDKMSFLATKNGKSVVREVTPYIVPTEKVGFAAASEWSGFFKGDQYFLQYLFASDMSLIYLTVEGKGKADPAMKYFDRIMDTQKWDQ